MPGKPPRLGRETHARPRWPERVMIGAAAIFLGLTVAMAIRILVH